MGAAHPLRRDPGEIFELEEYWPLLSSRARDNHYEFAHRDLRESISLNPGAFVGQSERDPEAVRKRLHALWDLVTRRYDPEFCGEARPEDFYNEVFGMGAHTAMLLYMPPAREFTEAMYVSVVLLHGEIRHESSQPSPFRYFTAELGRDTGGDPVVFTCEWTASRHVNFGVLDGTSADAFVARVADIVTGHAA